MGAIIRKGGVIVMKWGSFGPVHYLTLALAVGIIGGLELLLRGRSRRVQLGVMIPLSFLGVAATIYNLVRWNSPLEYLPLHLCSLNALVLPGAVITRNKTACNLLQLWSLGALIALVLNLEMAGVDIFSDVFFFYYFPHVMEFGLPILLFRLGLAEKDSRCILSTLTITLGSYTFVHGCNRIINYLCKACHIVDGAGKVLRVNYMFSMAPTNPLLGVLYRVVPFPYWYMFLVVPVLMVYLGLVYRQQLLARGQLRRGVAGLLFAHW